MAVLISSYTRFLNNPLIVQGVIVCLYVIQFTRYRVFGAVRSELLYSIIAFPVCQELFSIFSNLFQFIHIQSLDSFSIISRSKPFVKNFFQVFSNFFDRIFSPAAPAGNSVSLAQALPFVKNFFTNSFKFLHLLLYNRSPSRTASI